MTDIEDIKQKRQKLYLAISIIVLLATILSGYALGAFTAQGDESIYSVGLTKTILAYGNGTTEALIQGTQTQGAIETYETDLANVQVTQTAIINIRETIDSQLHATPTPN